MLVAVNCRIPQECADSLLSLGFELVLMPPCSLLPAPVASHPDMLFFILGEYMLTYRDYYTVARREIDIIAKSGRLRLVLSDESPGSIYPNDILFNAAPIGDLIFARADSISHHIPEICDLYGAKIINTRQGYARCSTVIVDGRSIITSDAGIAKAASVEGLDVLKVTPGHIALQGYDMGFIGGASGVCGDKVYFCGNILSHPDAAAITAFCKARGREVVSLGSRELTDVGTMFFVS